MDSAAFCGVFCRFSMLSKFRGGNRGKDAHAFDSIGPPTLGWHVCI